MDGTPPGGARFVAVLARRQADRLVRGPTRWSSCTTLATGDELRCARGTARAAATPSPSRPTASGSLGWLRPRGAVVGREHGGLLQILEDHNTPSRRWRSCPTASTLSRRASTARSASGPAALSGLESRLSGGLPSSSPRPCTQGRGVGGEGVFCRRKPTPHPQPLSPRVQGERGARTQRPPEGGTPTSGAVESLVTYVGCDRRMHPRDDSDTLAQCIRSRPSTMVKPMRAVFCLSLLGLCAVSFAAAPPARTPAEWLTLIDQLGDDDHPAPEAVKKLDDLGETSSRSWPRRQVARRRRRPPARRGDRGRHRERLFGEAVRTYRGHTAGVMVFALSPDGTKMVSELGSNTEHLARVWDVETGKDYTLKAQGCVLCAAWSADGKKILTGGQEGFARLWDATTGKQLRKLDTGGAFGVVLLPDGKRLIAAGAAGEVGVWSLEKRPADAEAQGAPRDRARPRRAAGRQGGDHGRHRRDPAALRHRHRQDGPHVHGARGLGHVPWPCRPTASTPSPAASIRPCVCGRSPRAGGGPVHRANGKIHRWRSRPTAMLPSRQLRPDRVAVGREEWQDATEDRGPRGLRAVRRLHPRRPPGVDGQVATRRSGCGTLPPR